MSMLSVSRLSFAVLLCAFLSACKLGLNAGITLQSEIAVDLAGPGTVSVAQSYTGCEVANADVCWRVPYRQVTRLTPQAEPGYEFAGWTGACRGLGYCDVYTAKEVSLDGNNNPTYRVTATFVAAGTLRVTNVSADLNTVLEHGQTKGACDRYFDNIDNAAIATDYLRLMCGKDMFFYEGFELLGVPAAMVDMMLDGTPSHSGEGFSEYGMIADPYSSKGYPIGLAAGKKIDGVDTLAFGCASCHFGKAGDVYAVGQANHEYEYGKHVMAMTFVPLQALGAENLIDVTVSDRMKSWVAPQVAELQKQVSFFDMIGRVVPLAPLLGSAGGLPIPSSEAQNMYLDWEKGTQDFIIDPVGLDDGVQTVSKMAQLWGMAELEDTGDAQLGFSGATPSLDIFVQDFIVLSLGADNFTEARRKPLVDYIRTLAAPANPDVADAATVLEGEQLFNDKGCAACHDGPYGSSTGLFEYADIGTDDAMREWADKGADGNSEVPELFQNGSRITHKLKAPKMAGLWAQQRFLHNGSVESLEALFCLPPHGLRPTNTTHVFSDKGHMMTCAPDATNPTGTLSDIEKQKMIAYLKSL